MSDEGDNHHAMSDNHQAISEEADNHQIMSDEADHHIRTGETDNRPTMSDERDNHQALSVEGDNHQIMSDEEDNHRKMTDETDKRQIKSDDIDNHRITSGHEGNQNLVSDNHNIMSDEADNRQAMSDEPDNRQTMSDQESNHQTTSGQENNHQTTPDDGNNPIERVRICVGGSIFITTRKTLNRYPGTRLAELNTSCESFDQSNNEYYFDRDPTIFGCILNLYRTNELHVTPALCGKSVRNELRFWNISESVISSCCWRTLHQVDEDKAILNAILKTSTPTTKYWRSEMCGNFLSCRRRLWDIMEYPNSSLAAKIWNMVLTVVVVLSVAVYCLDTQPELRTYPVNGTNVYAGYMSFKRTHSNRASMFFFTDFNVVLFFLDTVCLVFFSAEVLVHFLVCPELRMFFCSFLNWIDILTVVVGWIIFTIKQGIMSSLFENELDYLNFYLAVKSIYVVRLFKVFRLMQSNSNLRIIFLSVMGCKMELFLLVVSIVILAVIFGSFGYFCEGDNDTFESISISIWWAVVTMTTVGYGDIYPTTVCGHIVGSVCALFGILALTLPVAVIASNFSGYYSINMWRMKVFRK